MSLEIRRKGNKNFTHIDSDFDNQYGANDITIIFEGNTIKIRSFNGRIIFKRDGYDLSEVSIYDDTASGSQENFNDINLFKQRLINLGYPFAGGSVSGDGIPEAPNDGQQYGRQSEGWTVVNSSGGGIPEAPNDGQQYARQNEAWSVVTGGGVQSVVAGTNVTVDNTDPNNPIINASSSGGGYQNITESIDVNNDFDITIGDTNTAAIKVQNQNSFNYIEIGGLGLASRVDVPSTDIRLGDQFGFVNGVNMLIGGTQIELNTSNGFVLSTNFGTEKVTLKNDLLSSNVQYDVNFPDKANGSSETFAMLSDTKSKLVENLNVSGTYDIDYSFDTWNLVVTGATTFTESNLPTSGTNTKAITLIVTGEFAITFPAGWTTNIVGEYDGAVRNNIVVEFIKTGDYTVQITQPD